MTSFSAPKGLLLASSNSPPPQFFWFLKTFQHSWFFFIPRWRNPKTGCLESPQWTCTKGRWGRIYSLYAIFGKALWKEISQFHRKNSHKNFLLLLKIFQSTTYPTAHNLCNIKTKKGTCQKKLRPTHKYLNIKQLEVPNLHKKKEEWMKKKKKINISRT